MNVPRPQLSGHFIEGPAGPLAVVLWGPPIGTSTRGTVLYVPPAADEMNRSRRMVALQARALSLLGIEVALLDLRGTGDSAGEHANATWEGWSADVACAWSWLGTRARVRRMLWGLRLGALLAADLVAQKAVDPFALLLWQPVLSGRSFFNQFLRYAMARQMVEGGDPQAEKRSMQMRLQEGTPIEVAGYSLHPALVKPAETRQLHNLLNSACTIIWHETTSLTPATLNAASANIIARLKNQGAQVESSVLEGPAFWASQEITEAPKLIEATTQTIERVLRQSNVGKK